MSVFELEINRARLAWITISLDCYVSLLKSNRGCKFSFSTFEIHVYKSSAYICYSFYFSS